MIEQAISFAQDLIRIPTENPPGNHYGDCAARIRLELERLSIPYEQHGDCLIATCGTGDRALYFHGHYDVVPACEPSQFTPELRGANLFGRGSADMKAALAVMTYAAKAAAGRGRLRGRIILVFVPDEETAGLRGTASLIAAGKLESTAIGMLLPEPTSGVIWNSCRGAISLALRIPGKAVHVSLESRGVNAFERMLPVANRLIELKRALPDSILMLGGVCSSGSNFNLVPAECRFTVDRRLNASENYEIEKKRLLEAIGEEVEIEVLQEARSAEVPADTPLGISLARNITAITGQTARFERCPGLLEIRYYAALGIPAYAFGPGLLTVAHGPHELVGVSNLAAMAEIYAATAEEVLR